jgi:hypothetical protein
MIRGLRELLGKLGLSRGWWIYLGAGVAVLAVFGLVLWLWLGIDAFWPVLGIVLGVGLGGLWAPLSARREPTESPEDVAPQPFAALGRMALPLILPLLIFAVAGTAEKGEAIQFAAGLLAGVFAWIAIFRPEAEQVLLRVLLAIAGFAVAIGVLAYFVDDVQTLATGSSDRPGLSAAFLQVAVIVWAVAVVLRLASFATSWVRMAEAIGLAAALTFVVFWTGVIAAPIASLGDDGLEIAGWIALGVALLVVAEAVVGIVAVWRGDASQVREFTAEKGALSVEGAPGIAGAGLGAAFVAALALGGAAVVGLHQTTPHDRGYQVAGETIEADTPAETPQEQLTSERGRFPMSLVRTYMPELAFRTDQPWLPSRVEDYLATPAWLKGTRGSERQVDSLDDLPGRRKCRGLLPEPCFHLSIHCPSADDPSGCSGADPVEPGDIQGPQRSGAVYVHVVRRTANTEDLFPEGVGALKGQEPWLLIQYWFFYRYDEWSSPVIAGNLVQRHEGDWEAVMVGLSKEEPLFVAYSQHCRGAWRAWDQIQAAPIGKDHTHPLVAVAKGSQANYPEANTGVAPDWAQCSGVLPAGTVGLLSYASNIRDRTGYGYGWLPARDAIVPASVRRPPMSFPGFWGAHDTAGMSLENHRDHDPMPGGEPKTPSLQDLWTKPLTTVFCKWRAPLDANRKATCPPAG